MVTIADPANLETEVEFRAAGNYVLKLTACDGDEQNPGLCASGTVAINVTEPGGGGPVITQEPQDRTVRAGRQGTFTVAASGNGRLHYQWQRDGVDIPGGSGRRYTTLPATPADTGATFQCVVSDRNGSVTSRAATLTVRPRR